MSNVVSYLCLLSRGNLELVYEVTKIKNTITSVPRRTLALHVANLGSIYKVPQEPLGVASKPKEQNHKSTKVTNQWTLFYSES